MRKLGIVLAVAISAHSALAQTTGDYRSKATGVWGTAGSWETFNGTSWVTAGAAPSNTSGQINILSGNTISVAAATSADQVFVDSGGQLTINASQVFTLVSAAVGTDLTINGTMLMTGNWMANASWSANTTWTVASGGTYIHNTTGGISTPLDRATLASGSNFIYRGSSSLTPSISVAGRTYSNLAFDSTSGSWTTAALTGSNGWTVSGDLSVGSGVGINYGSYSGTTTFSGNVTVDGTLGATNSARSFTIGSGKALTVGSTGTVNIASGQTVSISSGGSANVSGVVSGAGGFTLASGGSFITSNATGLDGAVTVSGTKSFSTGANYEFQGAGTGATLPATVNNLTINRASGDVTLDGSGTSETINGTLNVTSGNLAAGATKNTVNAASTGNAVVLKNATIKSGLTVNLTGASGGAVVFDASSNGTGTIAAALDLGGVSRTFNVGNGTAATDMLVSGVISNGSVVKSGLGTLELTAVNTHTGTTSVSAGTLALGNVDAVKSSTLDTGTSGSQSVTFTVAGTNTYNLGGLAGADDLALGANSISVGANNATTAYSGALSGAGGFTKVGSGTITLSGANSHGGTTVTAGTLALSGSGTFGSGGLTVSGGTADLGTKSITNTLGALTGGGSVTNGTITNDGGSYDMQDGSVSAVLAGTNDLIKTTAGLVTLSGANTYSGDTTISGGTLLLSGAGTIGSGNLALDGGTLDISGITGSGYTLATGQSLTGSGSINAIGKALTIEGTLAPGNSPGTIDVTGDVILTATTISNFEIAGITSGLYDALNVSGSLTLAGTLNLITSYSGFTVGESVQLFSGALSGSFAVINGTDLGGGYFWDTSALSSTGFITIATSPIPEPSTFALIGLGVVAMVFRRRRRV